LCVHVRACVCACNFVCTHVGGGWRGLKRWEARASRWARLPGHTLLVNSCAPTGRLWCRYLLGRDLLADWPMNCPPSRAVPRPLGWICIYLHPCTKHSPPLPVGASWPAQMHSANCPHTPHHYCHTQGLQRPPFFHVSPIISTRESACLESLQRSVPAAGAPTSAFATS